MGRRKKPKKSETNGIAHTDAEAAANALDDEGLSTMQEVLDEAADDEEPAPASEQKPKRGRKKSTPVAAATPPEPDGLAPPGTRYLKCRMTPLERGAATRKALRVDKRMRAREDTIARLREELAEEKKGLAAELLDLRTLLQSRREGASYRYVKCEERQEPEKLGDDTSPLGVATYRLDTNERIEWRGFTRDERQGALFDPATVAPTQAAE